MEHPLQVEEFLPGAEPPVRAEALDLQPPRPGAAEAAPAAPLPPPPDLPASDVVYLRPGDPEYAAHLPASNKRTSEPVLAGGLQDGARRVGHGRLGARQQSEFRRPMRGPFLRRLLAIHGCRDRYAGSEQDRGRQDGRFGDGGIRRDPLFHLPGVGRRRTRDSGRKLSDRWNLRPSDRRRLWSARPGLRPHLRPSSTTHPRR